jgi:AraC-like DNA-binding protein
MRVAVIGAGGFGGYFGARLALGGADVCFLARGSHLAAMRANGLVVVGGPERICANPVRASDNPADLGVADFVLLAVKLWDTEMVFEQIKPMVGAATTLISFQNGVLKDNAESRIVVQSNTVVTAGAALSHLDLALTLIRRANPELADLTAKYLVADARTSQAPYAIPGHLVHADPLVTKFERWARQRLAEGFSLDQAAVALATSKRTLARRMQSVLGKSPLEYLQDIRIERAVHLLETSQASVDQIAGEVGYAEGVTLRALLRRKLGRGVREIRRSP